MLRAVNSSLDLETVLATIISRAAQLSQADEGMIYEFDATEEVFVPKSAFGMTEDRIAALRERQDQARRNLSRPQRGRARPRAYRRRAAGSHSPAPTVGHCWKASMPCWPCRCCARTRSSAGW